MAPYYDDVHCFWLANHCINHSKSPSVRHPTAAHDVANTARAIIDDPDLPVDKTRVAISGFSAGGNLALTTPQLPILKGLIKTAVPVYPTADLSINTDVKLASCLRDSDMNKFLAFAIPLYECGYLNDGQDLQDPLLSPVFAAKDDLPPWIYCSAAEFGLLAKETRAI